MTVQKAGPLIWQVPIVDKDGRPSPAFMRYFRRLLENTETLDSEKQPASTELTGISNLTTFGLVTRTADDTYTTRTLTAPAAGFTITNPAGVAGNPTFVLANDLGALEALSGTHTIYYRSAVDTWSAVTIGTGLDFTGANLIATGSGYVVLNKIAGYSETATTGEVVIKCDLAAGFTVTLPTAVSNTAKFTFKKMQAAGSIVIDGAGTETIDGGLTATLTSQYEALTIVSDNANWIII